MNDLTLFLHTEPVIIAVIVGVITGFVGSALFYEFAIRHRKTYMEKIFAVQRKERLDGLLAKLMMFDDSILYFISTFNDKIYTLPKFDPFTIVSTEFPPNIHYMSHSVMKYFLDQITYRANLVYDDLNSPTFSEFFEPSFISSVDLYLNAHSSYIQLLSSGYYRSSFINDGHRHAKNLLDYLNSDKILKKSQIVKDFSQKWKDRLESQ